MSDPTVASEFQYKSGHGGSSSIQILLETDAEAAEAWGVPDTNALATAGWHEISPALTGGTIGRSRSNTKIRLENDVEWVEITEDDEIQVINTTIVVDQLRFNLMEWMEDHYFRGRYALPTNSDGGYELQVIEDDGVGTTVTEPVAHWFGFERMSADKVDWTMTTERGNLRSVEFQLAASKPKAASSQRIYDQAILPLDTAIVPGVESDYELLSSWDDAVWSKYADAAVTP